MNRPIELDKLECYIKNVRYELKNVLRKIDEKITEPVRLKYTTPHYCPYCGELSLSEPHEVLKCSSCDMRFRLVKVQKEYPPIADLDDIDIMEIEADETGNVDLAKIEDVNEMATDDVGIGCYDDKSPEVGDDNLELTQNIHTCPSVNIKTYDASQGQSSPDTQPTHLPLRNFLIWLFNVVGEKTKTLTYYNVSALRSEFLRCMPNMCITWTYAEIENLKQVPELFHLNNEDETIKWVGESWIDSLNTVKELCGYPSNLIKEIDDVIQHIQDYIVFVEMPKDNEKSKNKLKVHMPFEDFVIWYGITTIDYDSKYNYSNIIKVAIECRDKRDTGYILNMSLIDSETLWNITMIKSCVDVQLMSPTWSFTWNKNNLNIASEMIKTKYPKDFLNKLSKMILTAATQEVVD